MKVTSDIIYTVLFIKDELAWVMDISMPAEDQKDNESSSDNNIYKNEIKG